jgi:hypothetical protein
MATVTVFARSSNVTAPPRARATAASGTNGSPSRRYGAMGSVMVPLGRRRRPAADGQHESGLPAAEGDRPASDVDRDPVGKGAGKRVQRHDDAAGDDRRGARG